MFAICTSWARDQRTFVTNGQKDMVKRMTLVYNAGKLFFLAHSANQQMQKCHMQLWCTVASTLRENFGGGGKMRGGQLEIPAGREQIPGMEMLNLPKTQRMSPCSGLLPKSTSCRRWYTWEGWSLPAISSGRSRWDQCCHDSYRQLFAPVVRTWKQNAWEICIENRWWLRNEYLAQKKGNTT